MKKNSFYVAVFALFLIPQIAFAAWWNPLSWFNNWTFKKSGAVKVIDIKNNDSEVKNSIEPGLQKNATEIQKTKTSTYSRNQIYGEFQKMKQDLINEVNSGPNGIALDNAWNTYNQSAAKYKEDIAPYYSNYRDFNQAQAAVLNNITGTYKIISENQMQNIKSYQDAVNKEYSYKLKQSETNFCDLNPKIKSESDRAFCHSLFQ